MHLEGLMRGGFYHCLKSLREQVTWDFPGQEGDIPSPLPPPLTSLGNVTSFLLPGTISSRIPEAVQAAEGHAQSAPDTRALGGAAGNGAAHNDFRCGFGVASGHRVITRILTE